MITKELKEKIKIWRKENPGKTLWDAFDSIEEIEKIELNKKENEQTRKIAAIYEKIADKTLSFGCKMKDNEKIVKYIGVEVYGPDNQYDSIWDGYRIKKNLSRKMNDLENYEIIGHPVMIGDVMDYIERNFPDGIHCIECKKGEVVSDNFNDNRIFYCDNEDCEFLSKFYGNEAFCHKMELYDSYWQEKRKPIEAQSDECVDFVFDLIFK